MRVCHALAGDFLEVEDQELQWRKPIDVVRQCVGERWGLDTDDLIVLARGGGLVGDATGAANEESGGHDIFFFLRSALNPKAEVPPEPLVVEPVVEDDESHLGDELLRLRAVCEDPAFEAFRGDLAEARRWLLESRPVAAVAARTDARREVQSAGAQAVLVNLTSQRATCSRSMQLFLQKYEKVQERFQQNLDSVDASMTALGSVTLHPVLQTVGREFLADLVPRDRILAFTGSLQGERTRLAQRLERLKQQDVGVQGLFEKVTDKMMQFLEEDAVGAAVRAITQQHACAEEKLLPELRDLLPRGGASPTSVLDAEKRSASVLEELARVCGCVMQGLLAELRSCWQQRHAAFVQRLREVSYVQSKVRDVERQAVLLEEEVNVQQGYSQQLGHLRKMPRAYRKMLHEIARRRQFRDRYVEHSKHVRNTLARMVEDENRRRRAFIHSYGCSLPKDLAQGLGMLAPPVVVEVPDFDAALPLVDFASLADGAASGHGPRRGSKNRPREANTDALSPGPATDLPREHAQSSSSLCRDSMSRAWGAAGSAGASGSVAASSQQITSSSDDKSGGSIGGPGCSSSSMGLAAGIGLVALAAPAAVADHTRCSSGGAGSGRPTEDAGADAQLGAEQERNRHLEARVRSLMQELDDLRRVGSGGTEEHQASGGGVGSSEEASGGGVGSSAEAADDALSCGAAGSGSPDESSAAAALVTMGVDADAALDLLSGRVV